MSRCDFSDLDESMCAHCRPTPASPLAADGRTRRRAAPHKDENPARDRLWFTALHSGTCASCGARFPAGTQIRLEMPAGWRAECCRTIREPPTRPEALPGPHLDLTIRSAFGRTHQS